MTPLSLEKHFRKKLSLAIEEIIELGKKNRGIFEKKLKIMEYLKKNIIENKYK